MSLITLDEAFESLQRADSILITTHTAPDGDAIGSMLGLRHLLFELGKTDVTAACQDPVPVKYDWMPMTDVIINESGMRDRYDLVVIIDVAQRARIGTIGEQFHDDQEILVLDHHREDNPCGHKNFMDPTLSSAAEIVADLYRLAGVAMTKDAAECIYVGLSTDTGGFRYANTDARSHNHAEELVATGIDVSEISARVFNDITPAKLAMTRIVLDNLKIGDSGKYAYSFVTQEDLHDNNAKDDDTEGLVNYARDIVGVQVGMLFREISHEVTKVSMRSKAPFDSSSCLKAFGGGGHAGAAGATINAPVEETRDMIVGAVRKHLSV